MFKVVIDTSVFVAAILCQTPNTPRQVLDSWYRGDFTLIMAPQLLEELVVVLLRRRVSDTDIEDLVAAIGSTALYIPGAYEATRLDTIDPDDNKFLAAAYEAKADYLLSLDNHLLSIKYYHGTQILTPVLFLQALSRENI
ncbi:putative toxin-antitoxin system toxin component, PIN family [Aerosakkonemataceae cyanobacterium BLCC-F50]|uniref:Toxin-antitoxin system toxin component, PIN family n=1 Tax=Floridaenema flaviceps BLCC-F50 TaxID=3153642 RepID=A0ABV4XMY5_9CYAN